MNEDPPEKADPIGAQARPRSFRRWQPGLTLTPEQAKRQTDVLRYAHQNLPSRDTTVAFLNTYNRKLGGVPLQLALASDEGLLGVEQLLKKMKGKTKPDATGDIAAAKRGSTAIGEG